MIFILSVFFFLFKFLGATIRSFADLSGAAVQINIKDNSDEINERILIIAGDLR